MDKTEKIINAIKQGKKPAEVASIHGKDGFTPPEQDKLVGQVSDLWDTPFSYPLLQTMYLISRDDWYRLKVLSLTVQHPSQTGENRTEILNNLEKTLNGLNPISPEQTRTWSRCQAIYLGIQALTLTEAGNLAKALQLYKQALEKYKQLGLTTPATRVQTNIDHLQSRMATRLITPTELSTATSPAIGDEETSLRVIYQSRENPSTPSHPKPAEKPEGVVRQQSSTSEEPIPQNNEQGKDKLSGVVQPADKLPEQFSAQISEYLSKQDQPPSIDESEAVGWQQSSEYPSKQNTTPSAEKFTEPDWWQTDDTSLIQDQVNPEQVPEMTKEEPQVSSLSEPVKPITEQASGTFSPSAPTLSPREIQDDIDQLYDQHKQVKSEIETLQQNIDEQFRVNAEKLLELADHQLALEKQIQQIAQRVKDLAAQ